MALLATGGGLCASAAADALDGGTDALGLVLVGLAAAAAGTLLRLRAAHPGAGARPPAGRQVLRAVGLAWVAAVGVSTLAYLTVGAFDVGDALFDSVSGLTTTGLTAGPAAEDLSAGVLAWRALSQWLGAGAILVISATVLPLLGGEILDVEHPRRGGMASQWARRVAWAYLAFTALTGVAYWLAGMGVPDAAAHTLTTVSTGGFSTTTSTFSSFGPAAQWVAAVAMTLAGVNLAVLVWGWRGTRRPLRRSVELRAYLLLVAGATLFLLTRGGAPGGVRTAFFTAASAASTTGYRAVEWTEWNHAGHTALFLLVAVGAMAGSAGGGFRVLRALAVVGYVRRELIRQLHPHSVTAVRVEGSPLPDAVLDHTAGALLVFLGVAAGGAMIVVIPAGSIESALDVAVAAASTAGPALGHQPSTTELVHAPAAQVGLIGAMLAGRLSLEVLVSVAGFTFRSRHPLRRRLRMGRRP